MQLSQMSDQLCFKYSGLLATNCINYFTLDKNDQFWKRIIMSPKELIALFWLAQVSLISANCELTQSFILQQNCSECIVTFATSFQFKSFLYMFRYIALDIWYNHRNTLVTTNTHFCSLYSHIFPSEDLSTCSKYDIMFDGNNQVDNNQFSASSEGANPAYLSRSSKSGLFESVVTHSAACLGP